MSPLLARRRLLVLQRLEDVQPRGAARRQDGGENANDDRGDHEHPEPPRGDGEDDPLPLERLRNQEAEEDAECDSKSCRRSGK